MDDRTVSTRVCPLSLAACTIVSPNYLAYARTLASSYLAHHPGHQFFVLIVADHADAAFFAIPGEAYVPVSLFDIGLEDPRREAMKYDILELNTNVKPTFLKHLIRAYNLEKLVYLDPDIFVYAPLAPVFEALSTYDAVLTPHMTTPIFDGKSPSEQDLLYNGTYNLGFFAVRRSEEGLHLLDWWEQRCLELGFSEGRSGLFVDQKWMNHAPAFFPNLLILRHPGCNMAYWNLHERFLAESPRGYAVNATETLCFFHFSGIVTTDPEILSRNTNRYTLAERPDLHRLFAEYKSAVNAAHDTTRESVPYGFDTLSDGTALNRLARRIYSKHQPRFAGRNPFDARGPFAAFAKDLGLVKGKQPPQKASWSEFQGEDKRVQIIHRALKLTLKVLGPSRYDLLMRYLAFISILRNQSVFLGNDPGEK